MAMQTPPISYVANASSPHVRHWVEYLDELGLPYHIYSIHKNSFFPPEQVTTKFNGLLRFGALGSIVAYILLGLWLRLFVPKALQLHAHNTSGYGLSAYLSGRKYLLTTYGSEIFSVPQKSIIYRFLIRRTLHAAEKITASSQHMQDTLTKHFSVPASRVMTFSLGVSSVFRVSTEKRSIVRQQLGISEQDTVWIYNRRITPLYRTLDVVEAFQQFARGRQSYRLLLLAGDFDAQYLAKVKSHIQGDNNIQLIDGFIDQAQLSGYLCAADVALSLPKSDQLSSSILEALSCGCLLILAKLSAYQSITDHFPCVVIDDVYVTSIQQAFQDSVLSLQSDISHLQQQQLKQVAWGRQQVMLWIKKLYA